MKKVTAFVLSAAIIASACSCSLFKAPNVGLGVTALRLTETDIAVMKRESVSYTSIRFQLGDKTYYRAEWHPENINNHFLKRTDDITRTYKFDPSALIETQEIVQLEYEDIAPNDGLMTIYTEHGRLYRIPEYSYNDFLVAVKVPGADYKVFRFSQRPYGWGKTYADILNDYSAPGAENIEKIEVRENKVGDEKRYVFSEARDISQIVEPMSRFRVISDAERKKIKCAIDPDYAFKPYGLSYDFYFYFKNGAQTRADYVVKFGIINERFLDENNFYDTLSGLLTESHLEK